LYTGVLFNSNSYSGVNKVGAEVNEYSFGYKELRIPLGLEISRPVLNKLTLHVRGGFVFSHVVNFTSNRSYAEISSANETTITYVQSAQMTGYKPSVMAGGALGADYKILRSRIRLQAGCYGGKVTAMYPGSSVDGKVLSINIMTAYIF
jgi:hypothetical protein